MYIYCPKCDEVFRHDSFIFTKEAISDEALWWQDEDYSYMDALREKTRELHEFFERHKDCKLVINNKKGDQLWPENLAEKCQSHFDKTGEVRTEARVDVSVNMRKGPRIKTILKRATEMQAEAGYGKPKDFIYDATKEWFMKSGKFVDRAEKKDASL